MFKNNFLDVNLPLLKLTKIQCWYKQLAKSFQSFDSFLTRPCSDSAWLHLAAFSEAKKWVRWLQVRVWAIPRPKRNDARTDHFLHRSRRTLEEGLREKVQRKIDSRMVEAGIKVNSKFICIMVFDIDVVGVKSIHQTLALHCITYFRKYPK